MKKLIVVIVILIAVALVLKVVFPKATKASFAKVKLLAAKGKAKALEYKVKFSEKLKALDESIAKKIA